MSEEDIKLQYITPALTSKWNVKKIAMEAKVTDGKINLKGNLVFRERAKRADYLLHFSDNNLRTAPMAMALRSMTFSLAKSGSSVWTNSPRKRK